MYFSCTVYPELRNRGGKKVDHAADGNPYTGYQGEMSVIRLQDHYVNICINEFSINKLSAAASRLKVKVSIRQGTPYAVT